MFQDRPVKMSAKSPGIFQNITGQSLCEDCNFGTFNDEDNATMCKDCEAGRYAARKVWIRITANALQAFSSQSGAGLCGFCARGMFQNLQEKAGWCPDGFTSDERSTSEDACQSVKGRYNSLLLRSGVPNR